MRHDRRKIHARGGRWELLQDFPGSEHGGANSARRHIISLYFRGLQDFETRGNGGYDCMLLYDQVPSSR